MTRIKVPYETIEARHPEELERLIRDIRSTKSGMNRITPSGMKWEYSYSKWWKLRIGKDLVSKVSADATVEERLKERVDRTDAYLVASHPTRKQMQKFAVKLQEIPGEVIEHILADILMTGPIPGEQRKDQWTSIPS